MNLPGDITWFDGDGRAAEAWALAETVATAVEGTLTDGEAGGQKGESVLPVLVKALGDAGA
ncbi:MAG: hypothetical protein KC416_11705, partial [Myxococcales bacterium]|nr:hypothetical protein [Myxococcales bacterium]